MGDRLHQPFFDEAAAVIAVEVAVGPSAGNEFRDGAGGGPGRSPTDIPQYNDYGKSAINV